MAKPKKSRMYQMSFAPTIPLVPGKDFSKMRLTHDQMVDAWRIIGPSVDRNINKGPLWQTITAAYLEGLAHGYDSAMERKDDVAT